MPEMRQNTEVIEQIATAIRGEMGEVDALINRLKGQDAELQAAWYGPARNAFDASFGDWLEHLRAFSTTLANVQQYLTSVAVNFRDLEETARVAAANATAGMS